MFPHGTLNNSTLPDYAFAYLRDYLQCKSEHIIENAYQTFCYFGEIIDISSNHDTYLYDNPIYYTLIC